MKTVCALALVTIFVLSPIASNAATSYVDGPNVSISQICSEARFTSYVRLASAMRDYVTPMEFQTYYIPLKKLASLANISVKTYGPLSATTHQSLRNLVKFVNDNQEAFEKLWEISAFYPIVEDLMTLTETLNRDLK